MQSSSSGRAAICQITSTANLAHNLDISRSIIRRAVQDSAAQVCLLPEASDFIAKSQEECYRLSETLGNHRYTQGLAALAKELRVWIVAGIHELPSVEEGDGEEVVKESEARKKVYNTLVAIDETGKVAARYRKVSISCICVHLGVLADSHCWRTQLHLFDIELKDDQTGQTKRTGESDRILAGQALPPVIHLGPLGPVGLEICYDLRFPRLHEQLVKEGGGKTLIFPSAFTVKTGRDHWEALLVSLRDRKRRIGQSS